MSDTFNTTVTNWQGVDMELAYGSHNLIESGSVMKAISLDFADWQYKNEYVGNGWNIGEEITQFGTQEGWNTFKVFVRKGSKVNINSINRGASTKMIYITGIDNKIISIQEKLTGTNNYEITAAQDCYILTSSSSVDGSVYCNNDILVISDIVAIRNDITGIENHVEELDSTQKKNKTVEDVIKEHKYINNFSSVSIGSQFTPSYGDIEAWNSHKITVKRGDTIHFDKLLSYSVGTDWVVFVNKSNIVVSPSYYIDISGGQQRLTDLSLVAEEDGYMYVSTYIGSEQSSSIITQYITLSSLFDNVDNLGNRVEALENIPSEDIVMPAYLDCPINRQTDIYLDNIIRVEDDVNKLPITIFTQDDTVIKVDQHHLRSTPIALQNKTVTITKYKEIDLTSVNSTKQITFRPVSRNIGNGTTIKNVCICGDSLIAQGPSSCEAFRLLNEDGDFVIHQIGTYNRLYNGVTYKHEGRSSWSWFRYTDKTVGVYTDPTHETHPVAGKLNEFMIDEELNFQKYMQRNFPDEVAAGRGIDIFVISLGTNDVAIGGYHGRGMVSDSKIEATIGYVKEFINALLSADKGYPNCKIAIGLSAVGAKTFSVDSSSMFKMSILKLNKALIDNFDNGTYHQNVTCVMHGCYIDRYNSYPYTDVNNSDYVGDTTLSSLLSTIESDATIPSSLKSALNYIADNYVSRNKSRIFTNNIHPVEVGYLQWGRGYYGKIRALLNGLL